ncbi:MAG: hypothetical protein IPN71_02530 [Fibrobacteres bacterium]|nr:hypothetical protein [Fibrobacterota bacterium]
MRKLRIPLLGALAALSLGLAGCYEKTMSADPTSSLSQDGAGGVSFRLSATELASLGVAVDSVRIEAERAGFPSRFATGSLNQLVDLSDLAGGTWNLKVALYDTHDQIQLYGEAVAQVLPGRTVDVVVHLRRASGSVRVRIILDDPPPVDGIDTIEVQWGENVPSWKPVKYWRTPDGVYLVSTMVQPCTTPYVTYGYPSVPFVAADAGAAKPAARTALMIRIPDALVLGSVTKPDMSCIELYQEHTHFIPWSSTGSLTLYVPGDSIVLPDPVVPPAVDTVAVAPSSAPSDYDQMQKLPVLSAWRDARGVYIATRYDCNAPPEVVETDMFTKNSGVVRFTPVRGATRTKIGCAEAKHILFVPTSYAGAHQVADASKGTFIDLPGIEVPPVDTSAVVYRLSILRADSVSVVYELTMDGTLHRTTTWPLQVQVLPAPTLAGAVSEAGSAKRIATEIVTIPDTMVSWRPLPQVTSSTHQEILLIGSILRDSIQRVLDQRIIRSLLPGQCVPPKIVYRNDPQPVDIWSSQESGASTTSTFRFVPSIVSYQRTVGYADGKSFHVDLVGSNCSSSPDLLTEVDDILMGALPPEWN